MTAGRVLRSGLVWSGLVWSALLCSALQKKEKSNRSTSYSEEIRERANKSKIGNFFHGAKKNFIKHIRPESTG